jgi:hypothetical protein
MITDFLPFFTSFVCPPLALISWGLSCWFWTKRSELLLPQWRLRIISICFAIVSSAVLLKGFFAVYIWLKHPEIPPGPGQIGLTELVGDLLAVLSLPATFFAKSWLRLSLGVTVLALLGMAFDSFMSV